MTLESMTADVTKADVAVMIVQERLMSMYRRGTVGMVTIDEIDVVAFRVVVDRIRRYGHDVDEAQYPIVQIDDRLVLSGALVWQWVHRNRDVFGRVEALRPLVAYHNEALKYAEDCRTYFERFNAPYLASDYEDYERYCRERFVMLEAKQQELLKS